MSEAITVVIAPSVPVSVIAAGVGLQGARGDDGAIGRDGIRGKDGRDGVDGDKHYAHDQSVAAATWDIAHNMNKYPSVTITDSAGDQVEGEVHYNGLNSVTLKFSAPFAGKAYLN